MKTFTRATVLGHIGSEIVMRHTKGGTPVVNLSIATNVRRKDGVEETTWHRAVLWDRLAEFAGKRLSKGEPVLLEGRLSSNDWVDGDGVKRSRTEIVAFELIKLRPMPPGEAMAGSDGPVGRGGFAPGSQVGQRMRQGPQPTPGHVRADGQEVGEVIEEIPF